MAVRAQTWMAVDMSSPLIQPPFTETTFRDCFVGVSAPTLGGRGLGGGGEGGVDKRELCGLLASRSSCKSSLTGISTNTNTNPGRIGPAAW